MEDMAAQEELGQQLEQDKHTLDKAVLHNRLGEAYMLDDCKIGRVVLHRI